MRSKTPSQATQQNSHTQAPIPLPTNNTNNTQTQKPHDTDLTDGQQAFAQLMQTSTSKQHIPKPTPASSRRLSQTLHNKPPTPPRPLINKRQRPSDSPQQS